MSTSPEQPTTSEIIGLRKVGSALESALGMLAGGGGFGARTTTLGLPVLPAVRAVEAQALTETRDPRELLPPLLSASLGQAVWMDMARPDDDYGADVVIVGFNPPPTADPDAITLARTFARAIRETCRPLDKRDLLVELGKLRMKAARRSEEQTDTVLLLEAYAEELRDYPADLVLEVLRGWTRQSRFWPAAEELSRAFGWRIEQRKGLLRALEAVAQAEARAVA